MKIAIISLIIVIGIFIFVIESVRRGILETKYSIIWILTCLGIGILSGNSSLINKIADVLNVYYAPSILFLFGMLFLIIVVFDLTRRISKMNQQLVTLTQEYAILKQKYEEKGQHQQ
ncbi:DUF2304 domain-containing protein [Priestia endophytica]|jgi:hypothetical protein|uniref:DUF2304 domain-containing protein n=1 Tax=Priestia endophytica TaxID=135735 RepID=UPI000F5498A2|nr:DUF2304 domain-containing protein [Priestia endophytica]MED4071378.1 DUF2304 domain-containing protein [Priestia endophytica]RPK08925.1 hypothetical protein FH5_04726 [Priestia endophytica]